MRQAAGRLLPSLLLALLTIACPPAGARSAEASARQGREISWSKILIEWPPEYRLPELSRWPGLEITHAHRDEPLRAVAPGFVVEELREHGFEVRVEVADLEERFSLTASAGYGSYHTLAEIYSAVDSLYALYPNIVTARESLATTWEGRTVWKFQVSDNPGVEEGEPAILIDALHHAREPMSVEVVLHYLSFLCANYGIDPMVTFLVDEREIWFVPVVNPDGYYYNESTNPDGGGMWRKNRRPVLDCFGVDLNRNYPYWWGGDGGTSDPCDEFFRGPSSGSEPEGLGLRELMIAEEPVIYHTFHSYGSQVMFPWGWTGYHTSDDGLLREVAGEMARLNGYEVGQPGEILPYGCAGCSIDWAYGEDEEKPKIYSFMTEVGGGDFWPSPGVIPTVCAENLFGNLYLAQVAGSYLRIDSTWIGGDGEAEPGETIDLFVNLHNHGVDAVALGVELILSTHDSFLRLTDAETQLGHLGPRAARSNSGDPFSFEIDPACPPGHRAVLHLEPWTGGQAHPPDSLEIVVGSLPIVYFEDFETPTDWIADPGHTASTGGFAQVDPYGTGYQPEDDASPEGTQCWLTAQNVSLGVDDVDNGISATRSPVIDLSQSTEATLQFSYFFGQRDHGDDPGGDYFHMDVSNDGGASFPHQILSRGDQTQGPTWQQVEVELDKLLILTPQMVFRILVADGSPEGDIIEGGIDEFAILEESPNTPPSTPLLEQPARGDTVASATPLLRIFESYDPDEEDALTYGFEVYGDPLLTQLAAWAGGLQAQDGYVSWTVNPPLAEGAVYWWRSYADDGQDRSLAMPTASFLVAGSTRVNRVERTAAPLLLHLAGTHPLPAAEAGSARFHFSLPQAGQATLAIYDVRGRLIRALFSGFRSEGSGISFWDARDAGGNLVASGIYLARLTAGADSATRKIAVVR